VTRLVDEEKSVDEEALLEGRTALLMVLTRDRLLLDSLDCEDLIDLVCGDNIADDSKSVVTWSLEGSAFRVRCLLNDSVLNETTLRFIDGAENAPTFLTEARKRTVMPT
jgi:hypothetical protein